ncbi:alternative ribosome rescue aminoacyl-tRNA hydrolase ArfB [Jiangella sp. DSM 45060]|uniref:alternative ribosome rescue aminoacyl-tRNA hydrolase ArfB n=1 Tax=Jiangella sp. DSM 45060 TaxID=1798224 RepID=UPI00087DF094|nr:alternative ribosome rescue aminoacyl-tRNA hydrolase ArfB [Jiangella sp. DSM 45060]SDS83869.1 ribosome-associated protein [Jiangella sp. DSM 45060]
MAPVRVRETLVIPDDELSWRFSRAGGPGGQGVNTTDSRVELSFSVAGSRVLSPAQRDRLTERLRHRLVDGVLTVVASEHRSQLRNREAAADRLAGLLDDALRPPPPPRRPTKPSRSARARRVEQKRRTGETKRLRRRPDDG